MEAIIAKTFTFDAAHILPNVPAGHPCGRMHGHTYFLTVELKGATEPNMGWVEDYRAIKNVVMDTVDMMDHHYLNEIIGLENPTAENICFWLWGRLKPKLPNLHCVELKETPATSCKYYGDK